MHMPHIVSESDAPTNDRCLKPQEVADMLGVKKNTLWHWRATGRGPAYIRTGTKSIRYRRSDVDAWVNQNRYESARAGQ